MRQCVFLLGVFVAAAFSSPAARGMAGQDQPRIAFVGERQGVQGLFVANLDGTGERLVAREPLALLPAAAWSPDGRSLVYAAVRAEDEAMFAQHSIPFHFPIYLADVQTGATRRLADVPGRLGAWWSPDGRAVLFESEHEGAPRSGLAAIYRVDVATRQVTRLTEVRRLRDAHPSPDGKQLVYASGADIVIANADGSAPRTVVTNTTTVIQPRWSPRGNLIAYGVPPRPGGAGSDRAGVWVVAPDGSEPRRLLEGINRTIRWSPDGSRLLVLASTARIVTIADGSVQDLSFEPNEAEFTPDGRQLVARARDGLTVIDLRTGVRRPLGPANGFAIDPHGRR